MTRIFTMALTLFITTAFAQKNSIKLYNEVSSKEGVLAFSINKEVKHAISSDFDVNGTMKRLSGDFKQAKIVILNEEDKSIGATSIYKELKKLGLKELDLEDAETEENIEVLTNLRGEKLTEAHIIITGETSVWLMISGDMILEKEKK